MAEDRRSARRARLSAVRATYEGATGERREAEVLDLSRGGLFLKSDAPVAVGKRLSLEIHAAGQSSPWPALGRVVWTRTSTDSEGRPAGMAVKLIDVEDAVAEAIDRLVQSREPTDRGLGRRAAPPREKTILGVGLKASPAVPAAVTPIATVIVSEPPVTPVPPPGPEDGSAAVQARSERAGASASDPALQEGDLSHEALPEPSIAIDLVARKSDPGHASASAVLTPPGSEDHDASTEKRWEPSSRPAAAAPAGRSAPSAARPDISAQRLPSVVVRSDMLQDGSGGTEAPAGRKRRGRGLLVALLVLVAAAIAAYVYRDLLTAQWRHVAPAVHRALHY